MKENYDATMVKLRDKKRYYEERIKGAKEKI